MVERFRRGSADTLRALDHVGFEVGHGEFFGIVGRNGSGKSTLLKCLAGIYDIDAGSMRVEGSLSPFVELGVGFETELSGRDNVIVNAVMLGLTRAQARERFDDIIAFGELEEFVDLKLKNYSSGMSVRLSFSVATQVEADVLLIDEVLAVGDAAFQQKCFAEFERLKRAGTTIVFVTHDMDSVRRFCDRALLLHRGRVVEIGEPDRIADRYEELNAGRTKLGGKVEHAADAEPGEAAEARDPSGGVRSYRPFAVGDDPRRFLDILLTLARMEFKLHYLGSALGYLWSVMRPLMLFGVTYFVFTRVGGFGDGVRDYGVYLLTSIVLWTFFTEATTGAASSVLRAQDLIRKLRFPRLVIPLAVVLKAVFNLGMNLVAVAILLAIAGVRPRLSWLELPLLIAFLVAFAAGIGMLVSALYVRFRDVAQLWAVLNQLLFFGSAVLYVITQFPEGVQRAMVANPLAMVFTEMRHALIDPSAPTAADVAGGPVRLLIPLAVVAAVLALGAWVFARMSRTMAEDL
ncbi:MAG: type transport system ATP-binding protein [Thermoleophilaceae bacterium]|jgi:ABC-type polysaccharide/polyol phosphate transport system ATPase subunit/ABC-type polysaccharide/polyol phosphate export permease|nr:type transport system ATP-binding protein [Thermoleophilaceae bacterium]